MQYRRRLRSRIIAAFVLLAFGLTALFAVGTMALRARIENQLVEETLQREVDSLVQQVRANPEAPPAFSMYDAYTWSPRTLFRAPLAWQSLDTGVHDIVERDAEGRERAFKLAVRRDEDLISFVRYDVSRAELGVRQMMLLLGFSVVALTGLAWLIGLWAASRVMRPVADLAARLQAFGGDAQPERLAPHFADDEVGQLAAALDDYAARMTVLVRRDREFNADVSHELRTPLQVIRGAAELMLGQPDLSAKSEQRLRRIERAVQQCTDLVSALLSLSRNERAHGAADLLRVAEQQVEAQRAHLSGKPVRIELDGAPGCLVDAPDAVVAVALGNLIGNACKYTREGLVRVVVEPDRVTVHDEGPGISAADAERLFERGFRGDSAQGTKGAGIGLAIVRRLADLYGWRVSIAPGAVRGAVAQIVFASWKR